MNQQILIIHGGDSFETYEEYLKFLNMWEVSLLDFDRIGWKKNLSKNLGDGFVVYRPEMPNSWNARYEEWKIWFEKYFALMDAGVILIGHSLGGIFLAKYLAENKVEKEIRVVMLVAAPFRDQEKDYKMLDFALPKSLELFANQVSTIYLYHSKDDMVVPFDNLALYQNALPHAHARVLTDRGHINQEAFPELETDIKKLMKQ